MILNSRISALVWIHVIVVVFLSLAIRDSHRGMIQDSNYDWSVYTK